MIGAEIAVFSWNHFNNQETAPLRMLQVNSLSLCKIGAEIAVISWNYFH
jgi:hypothetical protein